MSSRIYVMTSLGVIHEGFYRHLRNTVSSKCIIRKSEMNYVNQVNARKM